MEEKYNLASNELNQTSEKYGRVSRRIDSAIRQECIVAKPGCSH